MKKNKYVIFTIDFEAWFQIENLSHLKTTNNLFDNSRLDKELDTLIDFLSKRNIKCTFFILGSVALRFKSLVQKIISEGHEIASHGYSHKLNYQFSFNDLKEDIKKSKEILEEISQINIMGYRAPCFSIEDRLFPILSELNFKYDSSLNISSLNSRYGILKKYQNNNLNPFFIGKYNLIEYPLPVLKIRNFNFPISGGGYGRLTPRYLWKNFIMLFLKKYDYLVLYLHPWEIDPNIPRIKSNFKKDFANYYAIERYLDKLNFIFEQINDFTEWTNFRDIFHKTNFIK